MLDQVIQPTRLLLLIDYILHNIRNRNQISKYVKVEVKTKEKIVSFDRFFENHYLPNLRKASNFYRNALPVGKLDFPVSISFVIYHTHPI